MADRDDLDYFMEHAILPKDLRDLADRARSLRARERKLAELAREAYERDAQRRRMTTSWIRRYEEAVK